MTSTRRRARLALGLAGALAAAAALPAAAQPPRVQKARLALELVAAEDGEARLEARVEIDDGWHVQAHVPTFDYLIPTVLTVRAPEGSGTVTVDYPAPIRYKFGFAEEELDVYEGSLRLPVRFRLPAGEGPFRVDASLRYQACDDRSCLPPVETAAALELRRVGEGWQAAALAASDAEGIAALVDAPPPGAAQAGPATAAPAPARSLLAILLLALAGGFILNGMPCVLPILSLKVFGLVQTAGRGRAAVRSGALATAAGILVSFWALAATALLARSAGAAIGWGVQFQQPGFVAFLAVVILLFTLNLWGLFEIQLPAALARWADTGAAAADSGGHGGHFASGLFATLMATPCSAPFLGTALSFALGQDATTIVATLTAVGVGLALPYLALAVAPGAVRHLPRPGAWMDTLRGALGFLLAGALVWLLYVLAGQVAAEEIAFFELGLLAVGLALWFAHRAAPGSAGRRAGWALAILLSIGGVALVARAPAAAADSLAAAAGGIEWVAFDRAEAERLARSGRLVFVDVTADWCVTCKVNERVVLNTPDVIAAFRAHDVVAMKADWTNRNDEIARYLAEHGRYGIPFYLLYRPGGPPHLFGELITRQEVVDVLGRSAAGGPRAATPARPASASG